jgi:membrane protease subunit HflK
MQEIYSNVTKVVVATKSGSNLLYLPLDKIMQMTAQTASAGSVTPVLPPVTSSPTPIPATNAARSRERESR